MMKKLPAARSFQALVRRPCDSTTAMISTMPERMKAQVRVPPVSLVGEVIAGFIRLSASIVSAIGNAAQGVVNYVAIVDVDNGDLKLRPGMTANAAVVTAKRENALRLPNSALRFRPPEGAAVAPPPRPEGNAAAEEAPGGERAGARKPGEWKGRGHREENGTGDAARKLVYVLDEKGGLRAQPVRLGISDGTWTEALEPGPQEGDSIVTGVQTAAEKGKSEKSGASSPFMPRPPGPPPGR